MKHPPLFLMMLLATALATPANAAARTPADCADKRKAAPLGAAPAEKSATGARTPA